MVYKVLIADDEPIMRKAMQTLIDWDSIGCQLVYVASGGQEVMDYLNNKMPDILILDIQMPGINGIDLARYVYEQKLPVKVILLTAYADFSYAQHAVKCDVVDYVIKTGSFEELLVAIEKAKGAIRERELRIQNNHEDILKENYFKSIFDGSLHLEKEIRQRAERIGICFRKNWIVIAIRFHLQKEKQKEYVYQSLLRFFGMVFEQNMVYSVPMKEDEMIVILSGEMGDFEESIHAQCIQIVEMMDKFMKMNVYIGISSVGMNLNELKKIFDEAEYAVGEGDFYETRKISSFREIRGKEMDSLEGVDTYLKELYYQMKKGMRKESLECLARVTESLKEARRTTNTVFDVGIEIISLCKKLLSEYDRALYDIVPYDRNISHKIYQCKHIDEYMEVLSTVIGCTVDYINVAVSKKNIVIYEAEKYIEENYQKSITVSEIARNVGVSLSYLSRIYKETTGNTLIGCINQKKIEKAKDYLKNTDLKIYEIAEILSFENTTYFSYFFKKNTGMSPKEYKFNKKNN